MSATTPTEDHYMPYGRPSVLLPLREPLLTSRSDGDIGSEVFALPESQSSRRVQSKSQPAIAKSQIQMVSQTQQMGSPKTNALAVASGVLLEQLRGDRLRRQEGLEAFFDATRAQLRDLYSQRTEERTLLDSLQDLVAFFGLQDDFDPAALSDLATGFQAINSGSSPGGHDSASSSTPTSSQLGPLSFDEFESCASSLKLNVLLALAGEGGGRLTVTDYSRTKHELSTIVPRARRQWLTDERPTWASNRWVHLQGDESGQCLKLLAVKYGLHPLALEDALELKQQRAKAAHFDGHLFILFPSVCVRWQGSSGGGSTGGGVADADAHADDLSDTEDILGGVHRAATVPSRERRGSGSGHAPGYVSRMATSDERTNSSPLVVEIALVSIVLLTPSADTIITASADDATSTAFASVHRRLRLGYSLLRQSSSYVTTSHQPRHHLSPATSPPLISHVTTSHQPRHHLS